jgi:tripartite-type tricarboxylate transporter receptor subunit TctC
MASGTRSRSTSEPGWGDRLACATAAGLSALAASVLALLAAVSPGAAQIFPSRPVTIIVPFAAGGAADVNGRIIADSLTQRLGQTVIVENVAGAGGTTGSVRGKNAPNDGYTLLLGHMGTHAASVSLYPKLGYDPRTDFEPLGLISLSPIMLFARKNLPANTLQEFLAYARSMGNKLTDGHSGVGSISHITCSLLASLGGFTPTYVPYRGVGPMMNDMLGGNVDFGCDLVLAVSPQVASGNLKGLAIAAPERSAAVPDVPTAAEGGLAEFRADAWTGLFAPKGTPPEVLARLREAVAASLDDPRVTNRLAQLGAVAPKPGERGGDYLAKLVKDEVDRWGKVIKNAGIVVD